MRYPLGIVVDRREFLTQASIAAAFLAAHPGAILGAARAAKPRILGLELLTAAPLAQIKRFYHEALELRVLDDRPDRLTVAAGATSLTFLPSGEQADPPFYHFAFNIPENKVLAARDWQKARGPLMAVPERLRDPSFPDDVVHFAHWNAHSVFFFDPGGNVVEYIGRHDLPNAAEGAFRSSDILHASEIGLIVDDVAAAAAALRDVVGASQYRGADDQFTALGDEHGLLLVMKRGRTLNFRPGDPSKAARVYRTVARVRGSASRRYLVPELPYELIVEEEA